MKRNNHHLSGFTLIELLNVVALLGLLSAFAVPNFVKARSENHKKLCISNLRQLEQAQTVWPHLPGKNSSRSPADSDLFGSELYIRSKPVCPSGGSYTISSEDGKVSCSLAVAKGHTP